MGSASLVYHISPRIYGKINHHLIHLSALQTWGKIESIHGGWLEDEGTKLGRVPFGLRWVEIIVNPLQVHPNGPGVQLFNCCLKNNLLPTFGRYSAVGYCCLNSGLGKSMGVC